MSRSNTIPANRIRNTSEPDVVRAIEDERASLSRELHDSLGQDLACLRISLLGLSSGSAPGPAWREQCVDMISIVDSMLESIRSIAWRLRPMVLEQLGLPESLDRLTRQFTRRSGIPCRLVLAGSPPAPDPVREMAVFRIVQEALCNVIRHAEARHVVLHVRFQPEAVTVRIIDDGRGISPFTSGAAGGLGIRHMRERTVTAGGMFSIRSAPSEGTAVAFTLPWGGD